MSHGHFVIADIFIRRGKEDRQLREASEEIKTVEVIYKNSMDKCA